MITREAHPYIQEDHVHVLNNAVKSHLGGSNEGSDRVLTKLYKTATQLLAEETIATQGVITKKIMNTSGSVAIVTCIDEDRGVFVQLVKTEKPRKLMTVGAMWSTEVADELRNNAVTKVWSD